LKRIGRNGQRRKEEMKAQHLLELRKEIVRAWMRIEEQEWQKIREQWKEEASTLEEEFEDELKQLQGIAPRRILRFQTSGDD
jgi:hypothetical protein